MSGFHRRLLAVSVIAGLIAAALCAPARAQDKLKVVATFSILADIARNVGGDRIDVTALVGPNSDAHVYTPSPADARRVGAARVIVVNGLGYEGWISRLVTAAGGKADVVVASNGVKARQSMDSRGHSDVDPHAWQSVANVKTYVANIRDALVKADPAGKAVYEANAASYLGRLEALDKDIRDTVARIPQERRRVITSHDAFGYFKDAYGIDFIAPRGVSTETEASARDVAKIITQIRQQKVPAVFLENITEQRQMERIAAETGAKIGGNLLSDALTDANGVAPTYIDLMRHNLKQLAAALARSSQ
jgi:zinc/manganese transport system substrate-binding protein